MADDVDALPNASGQTFDRETSARRELLELTCVSLAKAQCKRPPTFIGPRGNRYELLRSRHRTDEKQATTMFLNGVVRFMADVGDLAQAERWMNKLDSTKGHFPSVEALNSLIRSAVKVGAWHQADEWLARPDSPFLHPEFGALQPNHESYDIVVQAAAEAGDLVRAERYLQIARERGLKVSRRTFTRLILRFLGHGEPRRAHHWARQLVQDGCFDVESYEPWVVRNEKHKLRSLQTFAPTEIYDLVGHVAKGLAAAGNTQTANTWLEYLTECGVSSEDYGELWNYIREATPLEIIPASLFAENFGSQYPTRKALMEQPSAQPMAPIAPMLLPAALSGEERGADGKIRLRPRRPSRAGSGASSRSGSKDHPLLRSSSGLSNKVQTSRPSSAVSEADSYQKSLVLQDHAATWRSDCGPRPISTEGGFQSTRAPSSNSCGRLTTSPSRASPAVAVSGDVSGKQIDPSDVGVRRRSTSAAAGKTRFTRGVEQTCRLKAKACLIQGALARSAGLSAVGNSDSKGLQRLLEARRQAAMADRAAVAQRGVDEWLSARG